MSDALFLAVLNALWQGAALVAGVALAMRLGLRRNATTACLVWSAAFALVAALPALDLALARPATVLPAVMHEQPPALAASALQPAIVHDGAPAAAVHRIAVHAAPATESAPPNQPWHRALRLERAHAATMSVGSAATAVARSWGIAIVAVWALVAGVLLLRLARAYAAMGRLKRNASPLHDRAIEARLHAAGHRRRATIASSPDVAVPCAIGFRNPMILLPAGLIASLDRDDLARVVLHESAHLQRYDDWLNAIEHTVCALQFFQPALHLASRRIDFEREVACDDRVLCDAGEPLRYAECLARIVERHVRGNRAAVVPGFVLGHAQVVARVRRIVDRSRDASPRLRVAAVATVACVLASSLGIAQLQVPVVATASAEPLNATVRVTPVAPATRVANVNPARPHAAVAHAATRTAPVARATNAVRTATVTRTLTVARTTTPAAAEPVAAPKPAPRHATHAGAAHAPPLAARTAVVAFAPALPNAAVTRRVAHDEAAPAASPAAAVPPAPPAPVAPVGASPVPAAPVAPVAPAAPPSRVAPYVHAPLAVTRRVTGIVAPHVHASVSSGGDLMDAIDEARYPRPSIDELIALHDQGLSGAYVRAMGALGRGRPALHDLISLMNQGVTPEYVAALDRRLATQPTIEQIVSLRLQGVSGAWLDRLGAAGYPKLSVNDAVALAVQGVSSAYVRGLLDAGLRTVSVQQILALHVQGVDGSFVRRLAQHGYGNLSIDEVVRLKVSGFNP